MALAAHKATRDRVLKERTAALDIGAELVKVESGKFSSSGPISYLLHITFPNDPGPARGDWRSVKVERNGYTITEREWEETHRAYVVILKGADQLDAVTADPVKFRAHIWNERRDVLYKAGDLDKLSSAVNDAEKWYGRTAAQVERYRIRQRAAAAGFAGNGYASEAYADDAAAAGALSVEQRRLEIAVMAYDRAWSGILDIIGRDIPKWDDYH